MKIIPNDFVNAMRELLTQEGFINDYHGFEQALFDEISTRKMDDDARKQNRGFHAVGNSTEVLKQDNTSPHLYQSDIEYETVQIWSGSVTSVDWHLVNVTAADQRAGKR